jgi:hypothetical protein
MLFCVTNISAEILQGILGYSVFTECQSMAHFLPNDVTVKNLQKHLLVPKKLVKSTGEVCLVKISYLHISYQ